jgi:hypothetical protein
VSTEPQLTYAALAATMELSRLRSTLIVGAALARRFPTEDDWWGLVSDPEYIESLNALAEVVNDIKQDTQLLESVTPETVAEAADKHHARALEAVEVLAELIDVSPEDLLAVLLET